MPTSVCPDNAIDKLDFEILLNCDQNVALLFHSYTFKKGNSC